MKGSQQGIGHKHIENRYGNGKFDKNSNRKDTNTKAWTSPYIKHAYAGEINDFIIISI